MTIEHLKQLQLDYTSYDDIATEPYFPEHMRSGLELWITDGIMPGGFLTAVLENDLKGAIMRADEINQVNMFGIVSFIYNRCPLDCWGSPGKVKAWAKMHRS